MTTEKCCSFLFLFACSSIATAQQPLAGKIVKKGSTEIIKGVTVINLSQGKHNISDMGGNYKIYAVPGDTILFTSAGYLPDTLIVASAMLLESYQVFLAPNVVALAAVKVDETRNYQLDSIKRREEYSFILDRKHPVKLWNEKRAGDAPGLSFSPIGYFSTAERRKRRLKRRLIREEEDYYIDYRFPPARVAQLTRLKGDSLQTFIFRYRPSYRFCRNASNQDILLYINDKLKLYRKR